MRTLDDYKVESIVKEYEGLVRADRLNGSQFAQSMAREVEDRVSQSPIAYDLPDWVKCKEVRI